VDDALQRPQGDTDAHCELGSQLGVGSLRGARLRIEDDAMPARDDAQRQHEVCDQLAWNVAVELAPDRVAAAVHSRSRSPPSFRRGGASPS
jgi:hypothetical protein